MLVVAFESQQMSRQEILQQVTRLLGTKGTAPQGEKSGGEGSQQYSLDVGDKQNQGKLDIQIFQ